jgi:hypothetical protein
VASDPHRRPHLRRARGPGHLASARAAGGPLAPGARRHLNETGPYYGFWSGFGSDIAEFSILGAIATGVYQLVKKHNCHEPGCWRIGNHPAAGGQFNLCYRHHPDFQGKKPTHEVIERLHREHLERQVAIHDKLQGIHQHLTATPAVADDRNGPGPPAHDAPAAGDRQTG